MSRAVHQRGQRGDVELVADHRGGPQHPVGARREAGETLGHHGTDAGRHERRRPAGQRVHRTLSIEEPQQFAEEERIPARPPVEEGDGARGQRLAGRQGSGEHGDVAPAQAAQRDVDTAVGQFGEAAHQRMTDVQVGVAVGPDDREPAGPWIATDELQQPQRCLVRPVEIVDDQGEGPGLGGSGEHIDDGVEEPEPCALGRTHGLGLAQQAAQRLIVGSGGCPRTGRPISGHRGADQLLPGPERRRSVPLPAVGPQRRVRDPRRDLSHETRLPDAGLATDEGDPPVTDPGRRDGRDQSAQLGLSTDEPLLHGPRWSRSATGRSSPYRWRSTTLFRSGLKKPSAAALPASGPPTRPMQPGACRRDGFRFGRSPTAGDALSRPTPCRPSTAVVPSHGASKSGVPPSLEPVRRRSAAPCRRRAGRTGLPGRSRRPCAPADRCSAWA